MLRNFIALASSAVLIVAACTACAEDAPPAAAMTTPAMSTPLTANPDPTSFELGPLGKAYVTGALSSIAFAQQNETYGDRAQRVDLSNAQVFVQKTDGTLQYFLQAGSYALPSLGTAYLTASRSTDAYYGAVPQAFIKLVANANFSLQFGKLPTLIGAEYTFTFENMNIERGLLWNQENAVNRGAQANYTNGPLALSLSWNDGFYSNRYDWVSGSAAYTFDAANIVSFIAAGNTHRTDRVTSATPLLQNNSQIYNAIYTHTTGAWTLQPYVQYTRVPADSVLGTTRAASTYGAALLANYAFDPQFSVAGRAEYIGSSGSVANGTPNLLYGAGSKAWSLTVTPTWQLQRLFARAELSYTKAMSAAPALAFGDDGSKSSEARVMLEAGLLF